MESGTVRPDLILKDLIKILHPDLMPEGDQGNLTEHLLDREAFLFLCSEGLVSPVGDQLRKVAVWVT